MEYFLSGRNFSAAGGGRAAHGLNLCEAVVIDTGIS